MFCINQKLPVLLNKGLIKLIIVDSVAGIFRSEYGMGEMVIRAKHMSSFAARLHQISHQKNIPVVCVNQVRCSDTQDLLV